MNRSGRISKVGKNAAANRAHNSTLPARSKPIPVKARSAPEEGTGASRNTGSRARGTLAGGKPIGRSKGLRPRSAKTAARYVTRRAIVAELFAEPSICEVPWCANRATDPHEPLTRARGGDILDRDNIRLVCHPHNVMFASEEEPWMYQLGFLVHSWDAA